MEFIIFIFSNPLITVTAASWVSAQLIKTTINLIQHKTFDKKRLTGAGGMPSSHSAIVCSLLLTSYFLYGYSSSQFGISFVLALIVMYDATGVRWAAGLHAKSINNLVDYLGDTTEHEKLDLDSIIPKLNESLGHRVIEVVCGAVLGVAMSCLMQFIREGTIFVLVP